MLLSTVTVSCRNCRALHEAVIARHDRPDGDVPPRCPRGARHAWTYWAFPGPCTRCGAAMVEDGLMTNWD
ncbi:hypothetical protein D3C72_2062690 [compost metagenome]